MGLFKFNTADEIDSDSHGERPLRTASFSWVHQPTLPANSAVGVATQSGFSQ